MESGWPSSSGILRDACASRSCRPPGASRSPGRGRVNALQELDPLLMAMPRHAGLDHDPVGHVHGREQGGGAVTLVVVGPRGRMSRADRHRLPGPLPGPGSGSSHRRTAPAHAPQVEVEHHDVDQLLGEPGIVGQLERPGAVRLLSAGLPDPFDHRRRRAELGSEPQVLQSVAALAVSVMVLRMISAASTAWRRGRDPRAASFSTPLRPRSANRRRRIQTVFMPVPSSAAISLLSLPAAARSTIFDRSASRAGVVRRTTNVRDIADPLGI